MPAELPTDLVPLSRAATHLHVNRATVWRWVRKGQLRAWRRAGSVYLVSLADIKEMLQPVRVRVRDVSARGEQARQRAARDAWCDEVLKRHGLG
jgi:excisionase family DNA binding protein